MSEKISTWARRVETQEVQTAIPDSLKEKEDFHTVKLHKAEPKLKFITPEKPKYRSPPMQKGK